MVRILTVECSAKKNKSDIFAHCTKEEIRGKNESRRNNFSSKDFESLTRESGISCSSGSLVRVP